MVAKRTDGRKIADKRGRLRHLFRSIIGLILFILIILIVAKLWLVPGAIRYGVERKLSEFCEGTAEIRGVEATCSGHVSLEAIQFYDKAKRRWLFAEKVKTTLGNWPSLSPVIAEIEVDRLALQILATDGRFTLPLVPSSEVSASLDNRFDIRKLTVREAALTLVDAQGTEMAYDNLTLSAISKNSVYEFLLNRVSAESADVFLAEGRLNSQSLDFSASLRMKHRFAEAEMSLPFAALNLHGVSAEGNFAADLSVTGCLKEPAALQPKGTIQLRDWLVRADDAAGVSTLNADVELGPSWLRLERLSICDANGVEWVSTNTVEASLKDWPGLKPVITNMEVEALKLQTVFTDDNEFTIPVWLPKIGFAGSTASSLDIQRVTIRDAAIVVQNSGGPNVVFDRWWLDAVKLEDSYGVSVSRRTPDDSNAVSMTGTVNPRTLDVDLSLRAEDRIEKSEISLLLDSMNVPEVVAEGGVSADLTIKGCIKKPMRLQPAGDIILHDWIVETKNREVSGGFNTTMEVGPQGVTLSNLAVHDPNGGEWLRAETTKLALASRPGPQRVLTGADISGLELETKLVDGRLRVPVTLPTGGARQTKNKHLDLQKLTVRDASVGITDPNGHRMTFDQLGLQLARRLDVYDIRFTRATPADSNTMTAAATFNPTTSEIEFSLQADMMIGAAETTAVLSTLNVPRFSAHGRLTADLTVSGRLKKPETLRPKGVVTLRDWIVASKDSMAWHSLSTDVRLNRGRLWLENLSVRDSNDLEWLSAETSEVTLENWPGLRPVLTQLETEGLTLQTYIAEGKLHLPVELPSKKPEALASKYLNLRRLAVRNGAIGIADREDSKITCDYLSLEPAQQQGFYDVLLTLSRPREPEPSTIHLQGVVNPTSSEIKIALLMDHEARKQETSVVFAALGIPQVSAEGQVVADLTIAGHLNELSKLHPTGSIEFDECILFITDKVLANHLVTAGTLNGRSINFDTFSAVVCNGNVNGSMYIETEQNQPIEFSGQFLAQKMSFTELTSILGKPGRQAKKGSVALICDFTSKGSFWDNLKGEGQVLLDDADVAVLPIIPDIFRIIGLAGLDPLVMSDARCSFTVAGPILTVGSAHMANSYGAIVAEPKGTINLQTKRVEMYVRAVPLEEIQSLIRRVPIIDMFFNLKDKLTRLYIRGYWSDPPTKLITKRPIEDIKDATIGFLRDAVESGGQISQGLQNTLRFSPPAKKMQ